uniref:Uncharacterized protein n=1 Tax=Ditylenchus dipsaci TaxID=166011 RepID=A0A915D428_9BILA
MAGQESAFEKNICFKLPGYGGVVALWFRLKYPALSVGVVSDSANAQPLADFYTYQKYVEQAYSNYSYECWHGIKMLNDELKLTPIINDFTVDYKNIQFLHHNLIQLFILPVVYNKVNTGPFATCCGMDDVCKIMSNEKTKTIDRVYQLASLLYEKFMEWLNNTAHAKDDYDQPSARNFGRGLFSNTVPMDYWIGLCADAFEPKIFSYTIDTLNNAVQNTTVALGLDQPFPLDISGTYKGSNALIYNGGHDPWSLVGLKSVSDQSSSVINIAGWFMSIFMCRLIFIFTVKGGSCFCSPTPHNNDPQLLTSSRNTLTSTVKRWVKGAGSAKEKGTQNKSMKTSSMLLNTLKKRSANGEPPADSPSFKAHFHQKKAIRRQPNFASMRRGVSMQSHDDKKRYSVTGFIRQDVDHFDPTLQLQFDQRFFKNDIAQEDRDAVRFLMIGAEAPIDWTYVDDDYLQYYLWAKDFHAVMYSLEHRFFGYSSPFENTSVEVLSKFLTTEHVLADLAVFVESTNVWENNTANPRWVLFGGSYGGNLVALFRLRYPTLSVGGVASSAAMQPKTDFYEYMQKVEQDIRKWGSVDCPSNMRIFFAWIRRKLGTRNGRKLIKRAFCLNNKWDENYIDEKDAELFLANMVFTLDASIQYDDEGHYHLKQMCRYYKSFDYYWSAQHTTRHRKTAGLTRIIENINREMLGQLPQIPAKQLAEKSNPVKKFLINIKPDDRDDYYEGDYNYSDYDDSIPSRYSDSQSGEIASACPRVYPCSYRGCTHVSYTEMLEQLRDVYRECFQGINHVLDICADVFGDDYNRTRVDQGVASTYKMYGGKDYYNGSRIVFVHGSEDPWSSIGVMKPLSKNAHSWVINGTSHCEDMYREYEHDVQELKDARKLIKKQIVRWVRRRKPTAD